MSSGPLLQPHPMHHTHSSLFLLQVCQASQVPAASRVMLASRVPQEAKERRATWAAWALQALLAPPDLLVPSVLRGKGVPWVQRVFPASRALRAALGSLDPGDRWDPREMWVPQGQRGGQDQQDPLVLKENWGSPGTPGLWDRLAPWVPKETPA